MLAFSLIRRRSSVWLYPDDAAYWRLFVTAYHWITEASKLNDPMDNVTWSNAYTISASEANKESKANTLYL